MLLHSCIIGLILYILMVFVFKQNEMVAENRSILITAVILIYMILFGHGIPDKLNKNL
jgi:ACR3 family arsenite efflux pump ArsB